MSRIAGARWADALFLGRHLRRDIKHPAADSGQIHPKGVLMMAITNVSFCCNCDLCRKIKFAEAIKNGVLVPSATSVG